MKSCSKSLNSNVDKAAKLLSTMGNARRLQIICILLNSEIAVGALAERCRKCRQRVVGVAGCRATAVGDELHRAGCARF